MGPNGKDPTSTPLRVDLVGSAEAGGGDLGREGRPTDLVFDFTGLHQPGLCDLSLILTARLQSGPDDRVWVRALPLSTWSVLRALGLDHLFHLFPGPGKVRN